MYATDMGTAQVSTLCRVGNSQCEKVLPDYILYKIHHEEVVKFFCITKKQQAHTTN